MRRVRSALVRFFGLFRCRRLESDFADELQSHLQLAIDDAVRAGLTIDEARRQATLRLGGVAQVQEAHRDRRGIPSIESLARDLSYAWRMMRSQPGFTATVVLTLGLGIGATTAMFTVVNGILLRPLPYPRPDRLVSISQQFAGRAASPFTYTENFSSYRDHTRTLNEIGAYNTFAANFTCGEYSERVIGGLATRSFFELLGARPALGRLFVPEEDTPGGPPVAVLSDAFWRGRLGGDPSVIGQGVTLDGESYTVVGVLPAGFRVPRRYNGFEFALWTPFGIDGKRAARNEISAYVIGRLRDGVTVQQAAAELDSLKRVRLRNNLRYRAVVSGWQADIARGVRTSLLIFAAAVGFLLLIACVNVANLLLSRGATREKELGLRRALGAGRGRIVQQLLTESVLLALIGGLLGTALSYWGKDLLVAFLSESLPATDPIALDGRVLLFSFGLSALTGIAFGLAPALHASRSETTEALKEAGRGASEGASRRRLRSVLVMAEVALATVLLNGSGLFLRSFLELRGVDAGYHPDRVLTMTLDLAESKYKQTNAQAEFFRQALEQIEGVPGVEAASLALSPPYTLYTLTVNEAELEGQPPIPFPVRANTVSPNYFRTLGIPIVRGRDISGTDTANTPAAALVNESFARRVCPGGDCLGRRVRNWHDDKTWMTIVGVVRDIRIYPEREPETEMYGAFAQFGGTHATVLVRTVGDPMALAGAVRSAIASVDRTQPPYAVATLEQTVSEHLSARRVKMILVSAFAALALALGAIGIYGVLSYTVKRRTQEIGVRLTLGASERAILGMVVKNGLRLIAAGAVIGAAASLALTRFLASELWGVSAKDPLTLGASIAILAATGLAASLIPALRAARVDPIVSLRYE